MPKPLGDWDEECDILIVGFGAAGACAALEAVSGGADTIVADRFRGGGASTLSGNVFYAGGGTSIQKAAGVSDTIDSMMGYLQIETQKAVADETLMRFCVSSAANLEWLQKHGVRFKTKCYREKTSYPPRAADLYFSGNETNAGFVEHALPAPRGHVATVRGRRVGDGAFYKPLKKAVQKTDAKIMAHAKAVNLISNENASEVIGVEFQKLSSLAALIHSIAHSSATALRFYMPPLASALRRLTNWVEKRFSKTFNVKARRAVILASGGFIFNRAMVKQYAPSYRYCMALGSVGCDGSAIRLAEQMGADTKHIEKISAWRFINPPSAWISGILVNQQGMRFCDESLYGAAMGKIICEQNEGKAFLILDRTLFRRAWRQILFGNLRFFQIIPALLTMGFISKKAPTLELLAKKCGFNPVVLTEAVEKYNASATDEKREDSFKKNRKFLHRLDKFYYAIDLSITQPLYPCPAMSLGGLAVNEESGAVCRASGESIKGLYAAGRAAAGIVSQSYVSGLSLADCVFSARRAGVHATKNS